MSAPAEGYVAAVTATTHVITARHTVATIAVIVSVLNEMRRDWSVTRIERAGRMAPLSEPDLVNPLVASIRNAAAAASPLS